MDALDACRETRRCGGTSTLLDRASDDADAIVAGLFDRSGVAYRRDGGKTRLD